MAEAGAFCELRLALATAPRRVNEVDVHGRSALMQAARAGDVPMVRLLLETAGVDVDLTTTTSSRATACHYAANNGHTAILRLLGAHGADVDLRSSEGATPADVALMNGHRLTVSELMKLGADQPGESAVAVAIDACVLVALVALTRFLWRWWSRRPPRRRRGPLDDADLGPVAATGRPPPQRKVPRPAKKPPAESGQKHRPQRRDADDQRASAERWQADDISAAATRRDAALEEQRAARAAAEAQWNALHAAAGGERPAEAAAEEGVVVSLLRAFELGEGVVRRFERELIDPAAMLLLGPAEVSNDVAHKDLVA